MRISGTKEELLPKIEKTFGQVEVFACDGVEGEFGFLTGEMMEGTYELCARKFAGIRQMIRVI